LDVHKSGDAMTGPLSVPEMQVGTLSFYDSSLQQHAFTIGNKASIKSLETKTQHITLNSNDMTSIPDLVIDGLHFGNTSNVQTQPFTDERNATLNSSTQKLTGITYYPGSNTTNINGNIYTQSLTCGNINTSHLASTTSNVQTQFNDIVSTVDIVQTQITGIDDKITAISYDPDTSTTTITGNLTTSVLECDAAFITNIPSSNVNMTYLSGLTSNVQQQLNSNKTQQDN
jgi:hypothetical protein